MSLPTHFELKNPKGGAPLRIPSIALGTWQSPKGQVRDAVATALKAGYRHIDCAWGYQNEDEVGEGIRQSGVPREEIWLTSKLFEFHHKHVRLAVEDTIQKLGCGYLDLYLMHWNVALEPEDVAEGQLPRAPKKDPKTGKPLVDRKLSDDPTPCWREMEKLVDEGLVRSIGISNFNIRRTRELVKNARIKPVANQVELSLACPQPELLAWLQRHDILPQAYSLLGSTGASQASNEVVERIAKAHGAEGANVLISWAIQRGSNALPKSVTPKRIINNLNVFRLSDEEFKELEETARNQKPHKVCDQSADFAYDIYEADHPEHNDVVQSNLD